MLAECIFYNDLSLLVLIVCVDSKRRTEKAVHWILMWWRSCIIVRTYNTVMQVNNPAQVYPIALFQLQVEVEHLVRISQSCLTALMLYLLKQ